MILFSLLYSLVFWLSLFTIIIVLIVFPFYWLVRLLCKLLLLISLVRVKVTGLDNLPKEKPYILAANHPGFIDFLVHYSIFPVKFRFVVAYTFFKLPFFRRFVTKMRFIPLGEEKRKKLVMEGTAAAIFSALKSKDIIFTFPEGQRLKEPGESIAKFRTWCARIAQTTGVPVVPIAVKGSEKILPKMKFLMHPGQVKVVVGQPIVLDNNVSSHAATEKLQKTIQDLYDSIR